MYIKKLVMNGFKSFYGNSEITFVKGISAIVGPNGCGKSNIIDAISWVIGEQKIKSLRANSMVDVIFSGTENKKGLGRAEVRLSLINDQNILPIDYNEIEIARIIFANGENEYYINKQKVRLKDIQELFFDTGVGKAAYSVMAQGKIDMILSNKPEDRRYMVEEAAGITKYRVKRIEAITRLSQSNENIIRIKDIIEEVKTQYEHMKKQAEKARKYKELYDQEMKLEIELNLSRIIKQKELKNELTEKQKKLNQELIDIKSRLDQLEDGVHDKIQKLTEYETKKIENQRDIFSIQSDIKVLASKNEILKEQVKQFEINIKNDSEKLTVYEENIKDINGELSKIEKTRFDIDDQIEEINEDIQLNINNINSIDDNINTLNSSINGLKERINQSNKELEEKRKEQKEKTDQLVVKIDQTLNIFDSNFKEIGQLKKNISENFIYILTSLPGKRGFIDDVIKTGYISKNSDEFLKLLENLKNELAEIEGKVKYLDKDIKDYIVKTDELLSDIFDPNGILQQKRSVENKINELVDQINNDTNKIEELRHEINKKRDNKEEFNKILHELNINLTTVKEKKNSIDNDVKRLIDIKNHHEINIKELKSSIDNHKKKINDIRQELEEIEEQTDELNEKRAVIDKALIEIDKSIKNENEKMSQQQIDIKNISNSWMNKKNDIENLNLKITEANTTIKNIYDTFYENYSIDINEYEQKKQYITDRNYNDIRSELSEIKNQKMSLGSVNLMAIEEANTLEERYNLLTNQLKDLEISRQDILEMIEKINQVTEELFTKTFKEIKANFHKIFQKLFDGGTADIKLTDPDNILETGIDIIAHPPGQKTQNITLLSGGQRTMIAISLMFAAFQVKPSPFCLLDEIDAALDEENITRFVNLLSDFKDKSQFIIITHNSKTISAADVMYGVTQEERGISKVVSAKISKKVS